MSNKLNEFEIKKILSVTKKVEYSIYGKRKFVGIFDYFEKIKKGIEQGSKLWHMMDSLTSSGYSGDISRTIKGKVIKSKSEFHVNMVVNEHIHWGTDPRKGTRFVDNVHEFMVVFKII